MNDRSDASPTPGPWVEFADRGETVAVMAAGRPDDVCSFAPPYPRRSDARLIAAAPMLLEALQACAESLAFARDKLGMVGEGDGKDRKADTPDDIGSNAALVAARTAIAAATDVAGGPEA